MTCFITEGCLPGVRTHHQLVAKTLLFAASWAPLSRSIPLLENRVPSPECGHLPPLLCSPSTRKIQPAIQTQPLWLGLNFLLLLPGEVLCIRGRKRRPFSKVSQQLCHGGGEASAVLWPELLHLSRSRSADQKPVSIHKPDVPHHHDSCSICPSSSCASRLKGKAFCHCWFFWQHHLACGILVPQEGSSLQQ